MDILLVAGLWLDGSTWDEVGKSGRAHARRSPW
ncbi:hypothetical protein BH24ACT8_BH24ACT8_04110 [soil metagenome]|jgi:hypothetical protein